MPRMVNKEAVLRAHLFRAQGLTLDEIMDKLATEFDEDQIPDRSTIARRLKKSEEGMPPEELREDVPFVWSAMSDVPWEGSRVILSLWNHHRSSGADEHSRPFTFRLAKWIWRVLQTFDLSEWRGRGILGNGGIYEPYPQDVLDLAGEYAWRESAKSVLGEPFETELLDLALATEPWRDRDSLLRYQEARDALGSPGCVNWRYRDVEFLQRVSPGAAQAARARSHTRFGKLSRLMYEGPTAVSEVAALSFRRAIDGLFPMQRNHYVLWRAVGWKGDRGHPWYNDYIHDAWKALAKEHPELQDIQDGLKEDDNAR